MVIPVYLNVRYLFVVSLLFVVMGYVLGQRSAQPKEKYAKVSGRVDYIGNTYGEMPTYNKGEFRYLKLSSYPYVFEVYEPNHQPTQKKLDDLKVGDRYGRGSTVASFTLLARVSTNQTLVGEAEGRSRISCPTRVWIAALYIYKPYLRTLSEVYKAFTN